RDRGAPLRAPGRDHHPEPDRCAAVAGGRDLGRLRRTWDALGTDSRGHLDQLAPQRSHRNIPDPLAHHPGRTLRRRDPALPRGLDGTRTPSGLAVWGAPAPDGRHAAGVGGQGDGGLTMDSLLYVESLTVSFDGFLALRNLNLIVDATERVRVVIGPNGAGKTTFF